MFKPYLIRSDLKPATRTGSATTFFPTELASLYGFPYGDGTGQKIGIIELGGGYRPTDVQIYFQNLGISSIPNIIPVSVDGAQNNTSDQSEANFEVILDLEIIAALVPSAQICVYFAPNSFNGFYNAINTAIEQGCKVISISWGAPESIWGTLEMARFNTLFARACEAHCSVIAAAGNRDDLSGTNVDFPASSPYVLACGGTTMTAANGAIISEVVWNNNPDSSIGGVSTLFDKPDYQSRVAVVKRGVPDVCANADPNTGYRIFMAGNNYIVGGTSAVAPLWAALITRINQRLGSNQGAIHRQLYQADKICRDIQSGSNEAFAAVSGWDKCTGLGSPDGSALMALLQRPVSTITAGFKVQFIRRNPFIVKFIDTSTGNPSRWLWNFGDGDTLLDSQNPIHIYTKIGSVAISLTVTDKLGGSSTFTTVINVTR